MMCCGPGVGSVALRGRRRNSSLFSEKLPTAEQLDKWLLKA